MAVASIVLSVVAVLFTGLGVLLVPVPIAGAVFAFGAPTVALTGIVLGGRAMSERRRAGQPADAALTGVILCSLAFLPALLCALTCGVCNALCSTGSFETRRSFDVQLGAPFDADAAVPRLDDRLAPPPLHVPDGGLEGPSRGLPPPPLPAGPRRTP
jgi:hypothetical protein